MKNFLFFFAFTLFSGIALCTTITIVNSGFTFSPPTVTINAGDNVLFSLASIHNAVEVSQATWNANGNTALPGGFATPMGGGLVSSSQLTIGTHWYVCQPHASLGMKGMIIVQNPTIVAENKFQENISVYPNPVTTQVTLSFAKEMRGTLLLCNELGKVLENTQINSAAYSLDISNYPSGIYFIALTDETGKKIVRKIIKI